MHTPEGSPGSRGGDLREGSPFGAADGLVAGAWIAPLLLLRARGGRIPGDELAARIDEMGIDGGGRAEVRRVIDEMEGEGLLVREGGAAAHDPTRFYAITGAGEAYLDLWADSLERYGRDASLFLTAYADRRSGGSPARGSA